MSRQKLIIMPKLHDYKGDTSKQWFVYFSVRDAATGKMKRFREYKGFAGLGKAKRYAHAEVLMDELRVKLKNGWNPLVGDEKVVYSDNLEYRKVAEEYGRKRESIKDIRYWCSWFLDRKKKTVRPATFTTYKSKLRYLCEFVVHKKINGQHPAVFTKEYAREFGDWLMGERGVGNRSVNEYMTLMRQLWEAMVEERALLVNVFEKIKRLKVESNPPRIYNKELMGRLRLLMEQHDPQMLVVVRMIFSCLIRPGELRRLQLRNIDFVRGRIAVPAEVAKVGKHRIVDVPDYFLKELLAMGYDRMPGSLFVVGRNGKPGVNMVSRNFMYNRFRKIKERAGVGNEYWLYAFKHTGMVEMKLSGVDVLDIRNQAGHRSLDQTVDYLQELMGVGSEKIRRDAVRI